MNCDQTEMRDVDCVKVKVRGRASPSLPRSPDRRTFSCPAMFPQPLEMFKEAAPFDEGDRFFEFGWHVAEFSSLSSDEGRGEKKGMALNRYLIDEDHAHRRLWGVPPAVGDVQVGRPVR